MAKTALTVEQKNKIWQAFNTMSYNDEELAKDLEKAKVPADPTLFNPLLNNDYEIDSINLLSLSNFKWEKTSFRERRNILKKLAAKIETDSGLMQIGRKYNIADKDLKAHLKLLVDYLCFYALIDCKDIDEECFNDKLSVYLDPIYPFSFLGCILGPCILLGQCVRLATENALYDMASYILKMATFDFGLQKNLIEVTTSDSVIVESSNNFIFGDRRPLGDIYTKFEQVNYFHSTEAPMLVFESADLDSTAGAVVDAAWGYHGSLPWSAKTIFVQENIYQQFLQKLKKRLERGVDIRPPKLKEPAKYFEKYTQTSKDAIKQGLQLIEITNSNSLYEGEALKPLVFTGPAIGFTKNRSTLIPFIHIAPFRTIKEGIALANNSTNGLAASVWSENTSLIHEVVDALDYGTIWVNSHGLFDAQLSIRPFKNGNCYMGGKEGLFEFAKKTLEFKASNNVCDENKIKTLRAAQKTWSKFSRFERAKILLQAKDMPEEYYERVAECFSTPSAESSLSNAEFNVMIKRQAVGIVFSGNIGSATAALIEGNAVVMTSQLPNTKQCSHLQSLLPKGLLLNIEEEDLSAFLRYIDAISITAQIKAEQPRSKLTRTKTIWFNKGQSI